jgi:hypothetical protein
MLKNLFIGFCVLIVLAGCSASRPVNTESREQIRKRDNQVSFIDNISITAHGPENNLRTAAPVNGTAVGYASAIEACPALQFKYAILLDAEVEELHNPKLLQFMDQWYGTPYQYGGNGKEGIDCSAFACLLLAQVYEINGLPRISKDQYLQTRRIGRPELQEGDLVFFHTRGKKKQVTHVGIYLRNNKFVHASVSGVMISDLSTGYYKQCYIGAGRVEGRD